MRFLMVGVLLLLAGGSARATEYVYNASDGLYYDGSVAYVRSSAYHAGYYYYSGCCRYWQPAWYSFSYVKVPVLVKADTELTILARAVAARTERDGKIKEAAIKHALFNESARLLGLAGEFRYDPYPYGPPLAANFVAQGDTVYGVRSSVSNTIASFYGGYDNIPLAIQQAKYTTDIAQQANAKMYDVVGLDAQAKGNVALMLATGQAIREARTSGTVRNQTTIAEPAAAGHAVVGPPAPVGLAFSACIACHSPEKKQGGFDLSTYGGMSKEDKFARVWGRINPSAPKELNGKPFRMPPGDNPLTVQQALEIMQTNPPDALFKKE